MHTLALFDFDGTITRGDSLLVFLRHMVGVRAAAAGTPEVLGQWINLLLHANLTHSSAKESLLRVHLRSRTREEWDAAVRAFHATLGDGYYNSSVLKQLRNYQARGAKVVIVSASIDIWLQPFAEALESDLICTRSKWENGLWMGFDGKNCRGREKVRRVKQAYNLDAFSKIVAFGNTGGDYDMLNLADESWLVTRNGQVRAWRKKRSNGRQTI
jgi:phosphatidylglycerophosphatase C